MDNYMQEYSEAHQLLNRFGVPNTVVGRETPSMTLVERLEQIFVERDSIKAAAQRYIAAHANASVLVDDDGEYRAAGKSLEEAISQPPFERG